MSVEELRQIENLTIFYIQLESFHKCMPVGGSLGYDTFLSYTFINLLGYG